jgi:hypothetical protein
VIKAYLFGPVAPVWMSSGPMALVWGLLGPGALLVAFGLLLARGPFFAWLQTTPRGDGIGLALVTALFLAIFAAWSRAIASANRDRIVVAARDRRWLRDGRFVTLAGLLVPGLGFMFVGRRYRAAFAFSLLGPLLAGGWILFRWPALATHTRSGAVSAIPMIPLELAVLAATIAVVGGAAFWIVQALDAARFVKEKPGSARGGLVATALLVALVGFGLGFRPTGVAGTLHTQAVSLQLEGFRVLPWMLTETCVRLDPLDAVYRVDAAGCAASLGLRERAEAHHAEVERRAGEWMAAREELETTVSVVASTPANRWTRLAGLYR